MDGIKIEVTGNVARVMEKPAKITAGTVGLPVEFTFDDEHWAGLSKTAVFLAGHMCKIAERLDTEAIVPWEILEKPGAWLHIGVYGVNEDGSIAIPTTLAKVSAISPSAHPDGDPSTDPTLPVYQELIGNIGDPVELNTNNKDNLVEAINEVHNIAKAGGVETDTTLSVEGSPADAAAVGEALANQSAAVEEALATHSESVDEALTNQVGQKTAKGGEIFNFYTDPVYTGDNPPKEYPGNTAAKGSHAEGFGTHADGEYAHAEGWNSTASGGIAHAEGKLTKAAGYASHAEGGETQANGSYAHSEGLKTEANAPYSHAEGEGSKTEYDGTNGKYAHAEGFRTTTYNTAAHAEGVQTEARGYASHTGGRGTIATCRYQMATGMFNIPDEVKYSDGRGEYAEIVGGGSNEKNRSNIYTLDWDGNGWFSGGVYVGEYNGRYKKLATVYEIPTTAAEVGAVPTTRTVNGRALSSNISLTASDVGAAPAGFGLGGGSISISDANAVAANGWYYIAAGTVNKPEHITYGTLFHKVRTSNNMMQEVIDIFGNMAVRTLRDGIWQEWEYVNPPMMPDIEYRTTERSGGLPVYTKTFALQPNVMTSFGIGEYDHGITGFKYLCRVEARTENDVLPLITNERTVCIAGVTSTKVKIAATKQDFTDYTSITLWYTKN